MVNYYETILTSKKRVTLSVAFRQGKLFESFKESQNFMEVVKGIGVRNSTVYFKIKLK